MIIVKPVSRQRSFFEWFEQKHRINFDPSYQRRGDLWPLVNKRLFINTILNGYDFPKIYFADFSYADSDLNEAKTMYAVIDGKQRLTTVFQFLENVFTLDDTPVIFEDQEYNLDGHTYESLKVEYDFLARQIENYVPTIVGVISDRIQDILEMFIRLNLNVSISGPERRNAFPGPIPKLLKDVTVHNFFRFNCGFAVSRGQDLNLACKLLLLDEKNDFATVKKNDLDTFVKDRKEMPEDKVEILRENVANVLDAMSNQVFTKADQLLKSPTQIPIYYFMVKNNISKPNVIAVLHDFLVEFEEERKQVRAQMKLSPEELEDIELDTQLVAYNNLLRSPDDKNNMKDMYKNITHKLNAYLLRHV